MELLTTLDGTSYLFTTKVGPPTLHLQGQQMSGNRRNIISLITRSLFKARKDLTADQIPGIIAECLERKKNQKRLETEEDFEKEFEEDFDRDDSPTEQTPESQAVKSPSEYARSLPEPGSGLKKMDELLGEGDLKGFYLEAKSWVDPYEKDKEKKFSEQEFIDMLWVSYYVAKAPLFHEIDSDQRDFLVENENIDIKVKDEITMFLTLPDSPVETYKGEISGLDEKTLMRMKTSYFAEIYREMLKDYVEELALFKELNKKRDEIRERERPSRPSENKSIQILNLIEYRNPYFYIYKLAYEKFFVERLVRYFPGEVGEVNKYIKQAGFAEEEIPDLIDRTVGRDGKTEFLYKGRKEVKKKKK